MELVRLIYVGPHRGVEVLLGDGREVVVMQGEGEDFSPEVAESLLAQGPDFWREPEPEPFTGDEGREEEGVAPPVPAKE